MQLNLQVNRNNLFIFVKLLLKYQILKYSIEFHSMTSFLKQWSIMTVSTHIYEMHVPLEIESCADVTAMKWHYQPQLGTRSWELLPSKWPINLPCSHNLNLDPLRLQCRVAVIEIIIQSQHHTTVVEDSFSYILYCRTLGFDVVETWDNSAFT